MIYQRILANDEGYIYGGPKRTLSSTEYFTVVKLHL